MADNGGGFDEGAKFEAHFVDDKKGGAGADDEVFTEVAVEVVVRFVGEEAVDPKVVAEVSTQRVVFGDHADLAGLHDAGYDLVADIDGFADGVHDDFAADLNDFAGALVAEHVGGEAEGVVLVAVDVGSADAAGFDADEDFIRLNGAERELLDGECFF